MGPVVKLFALVVPLVVLGLVLSSGSCLATTYYVSFSSGDDSYPGTQAQPWKTLGKISSVTFQSGDEVLLKCGDTWSGEELILNGNGSFLDDEWITLSSYGTGAKPRITSPPYDMTAGLVQWDAVNEGIPGTDRYYMKIAIKIQASIGGWKIKGLEVDTAEMGIYTPRGTWKSRIWIEDCYIHDILGLKMPMPPGWLEGTAGMWTPYPEPSWGSAIWVDTDYLTVKDVVIQRVTGGIDRWTVDGLVENCYVEKAWSGGMTVGALSMPSRYNTILDAQWPDGAWFGVDPYMLGWCTDMHIERCQISGTDNYGSSADASALDFDGANVDCSLRDCFLYDNVGSAIELHLAGENHLITVDNNICLNNGTETNPSEYLQVAFSADACLYYPTATVTISNNKIYKWFEDQYLNFYFYGSAPPYGYQDNDFQRAIDNSDYTVTGNTIYEDGTYSLPLPIPTPPSISQTDLASSATVTVSSGSGSASLAKDGSLTTEWVSTEASPWIKYTWGSSQSIDTIRLFDRASLANWCTSGKLTFSDGRSINVTGGILDNGAMREVKFDAKTVTWVQFTVTRSTGTANGLTEFAVYEAETPPQPPSPPDSGDFTITFEDRPAGETRLTGRYPDNKNGIDWRYADWTTKKLGQNTFLYADFPGQTYVWRMFVLPKGKLLKSVKVSGRRGAICCFYQPGRGMAVEATNTLTTYNTGWTSTGTNSEVVQVGICTPSGDVTGVKIDDITYGD